MTRDELVEKVAECLREWRENRLLLCPDDKGLLNPTCGPNQDCDDGDCARCWATAIVDLVLGEMKDGERHD